MTFDLWPHQQGAVATTLSAVQSGRNSGLWVMPTGTGKTRAFVTLARHLDLPTLVVVHRDELSRQAATTFHEVWPEVSVAALPGQGWQDAEVVVATVQSLRGKLSSLSPDRFGLVVLDEAHHAPARSWLKVIEHFRPRLLLGCTATPERLDGKKLSGLFGEKPLYAYGLEQAITDGYLVPLRQRAILTDINLDEVKVRMGDFSVRDLTLAVATQARNRAVVRAYQEHAADRKALVFAVDVKHVEQLRVAFEEAGIPAAAVVGRMKLEERRRVLHAFAEGDYRVLIGCEVLTEGYDEKSIGCVIMARPTMSKALYQQSIGRGLRLHTEAGKKDCLVLDIRDRCTRQRLVTASHLFGADVPDCHGGDVMQAARAERARYQLFPLVPSPSLKARWETGEETRWATLPSLQGYRAVAWWQKRPATEKQLKLLGRFGFDSWRDLTRGEAGYLIDECNRLDELYPTPATPGQEWVLRSRGQWRSGISKRAAMRMIASLMQRAG
jgi:superfamily II DNA or RNA helicase